MKSFRNSKDSMNVEYLYFLCNQAKCLKNLTQCVYGIYRVGGSPVSTLEDNGICQIEAKGIAQEHII